MADLRSAPLETYRDRTVSRFRARDETRDTVAHSKAAETTVRARCERVFRSRADGNGKLAPDEIAGLSRSFVDAYANLSNVVRTEDSATDATRVRPNAAARSHLRVHALRDDASTVWITSARMRLTRRVGSFETARNEFSWYVHAQERLHERVRGVGRGDVAIAKAVLHNLAFLRLATTIREKRALPDRLAVPCMDGLLCGAFVKLTDSNFTDRTTRIEKGAFRDTVVRPLSMAYGLSTAWRAWTYVGPDELFPNQREYLARWEEIRLSMTAVNDLSLESFSLPAIEEEFQTFDKESRDRLEAAFGPVGFHRTAERIASFLMEPAMAKAAGTFATS